MSEEINKKEVSFSGEQTINTALQLIRYDIPVLILGKSSIGKSYTLIKITEKWNISHSLLYIGSEKSENIEGVPKLTDRKEGKEILEYLQPYWFPNADVITKSVSNGRAKFELFIKDYWDVKNEAFTPTYTNLMSILSALEEVSWETSDLDKAGKKFVKGVKLVDYQWIELTGGKKERKLNSSAFPLEKSGQSNEEVADEYYRDDLKDLCAYLTTVLGFGNFWLILDEIDKVEEMDTDKFAPLLHIVRERTLKNFKMIDINNGNGLGIPLGKDFKEGGYASIIKNVNNSLDSGESVLDTRVMAIANQTANIEDALFRRFVQLIAEEVMIWRESDLPKDATDIEKCLSSVKDEMRSSNLHSGSLVSGLRFKKLLEINLQWQYNFFPKMLNDNDVLGNYFKLNALSVYDDVDARGGDIELNWRGERKLTSFYKVLSDNFSEQKVSGGNIFNTPLRLFNCLESSLIITGNELGVSVKTQEEEIKGVQAILKQKESEGLEPSLIAFEIANNLRSQYPKASTKEKDKLNLLKLWTDNIIDYLRASIFSTPTSVNPLEVSKFLVPSLVNVFYTEIAKDKSTISDNAVSVTETLQAFFKEVYDIDPSFSLKCDEDTTLEALYNEQGSAEDSLFGNADSDWVNSASGRLTLTQMENGLSLYFPLMVKLVGFGDTAEKLVENDGAVEFLQANLKPQLKVMEDDFLAQSKKLNKEGKKDSANNFFETSQLIKAIMLGN
jgi:hypothetical protein